MKILRKDRLEKEKDKEVKDLLDANTLTKEEYISFSENKTRSIWWDVIKENKSLYLWIKCPMTSRDWDQMHYWILIIYKDVTRDEKFILFTFQYNNVHIWHFLFNTEYNSGIKRVGRIPRAFYAKNC